MYNLNCIFRECSAFLYFKETLLSMI